MSVVINGTTGITNPNSMTIGNGGGSIATNTAVGTSALAANTTGVRNSSFGDGSLASVSTGNDNSAFGQNSLNANTASNNTAFGASTLRVTISGSDNSAFGGYALRYNTTGSNNTAVGREALINNTTASNNTAVGYQAMYSNVTGTENAAIGYRALYTNTYSYSTAVGFLAGNLHNANDTTGSTFVGSYSGQLSTSGLNNTFIGASAGSLVTTGGKSTIIGTYNGNQGGLDIRTASNYIVLSDGDGNPRFISDGSGNILMAGTAANPQTFTSGSGAQIASGGNFFNAVSGDRCATFNRTASDGNILEFARNGSNKGSISISGSTTSYNTSSDYRLKNTIAPMTGALARVAALKPVTYKWNADDSDGEGFIAHELAEVVPQCVTGEKDAVDADGNPIYQGIDTSFLVATLTAAIQELNAKVEAQAAEIAALKGQA